jgi:hypothetical protein
MQSCDFSACLPRLVWTRSAEKMKTRSLTETKEISLQICNIAQRPGHDVVENKVKQLARSY